MTEHVYTAGMLAGGLGLFMLAVGMITDGLKLAAGHALRDMLGSWTRSPAHGIASGLLITAIVQSSSAVTVATIGFVNAGLLNLYQALGVVYGANIGTTVTGWLVAVVGFKIKVETFALPMIGLGMLLRLSGGHTARAPLGLALAGFGLFFIGIDVLREAFTGLAETIDLQRFNATELNGILSFLGIGFLMTLLTQSSSAAIAIILTAAGGGVVELNAAAAMVIGANVGTTSTAGFAVIGATANARRVAAAHVVFNLVTGVAAVLLLPLLFWIVRSSGRLLGLEDIPTVTLALFHTVFNVLGVLLLWPFNARLTAFLERRFVSAEENAARPRYLDATVAVSPALALNALALEMVRMAGVVRRMSAATLSAQHSGAVDALTREHVVATSLAHAIEGFIGRLNRENLTTGLGQQLAALLAAEQHLLAAADLALEVSAAPAGTEAVEPGALAHALNEFRIRVSALLDQADIEAEAFSMATVEAELVRMQNAYDEAKAALLSDASELRRGAGEVIATLEQLSAIRRMTRQLVKGVRGLSQQVTLAGVSTTVAVSPQATHESA